MFGTPSASELVLVRAALVDQRGATVGAEERHRVRARDGSVGPLPPKTAGRTEEQEHHDVGAQDAQQDPHEVLRRSPAQQRDDRERGDDEVQTVGECMSWARSSCRGKTPRYETI